MLFLFVCNNPKKPVKERKFKKLLIGVKCLNFFVLTVDIKEYGNSLNYVDSIPAISAFTRIDYLPSFHGKDKIRPANLWLYTQKNIDVFKYFEETETIALNIPVMPELACNMYGYKNKNYPQSIGLEFWRKKM